MNPTTDLLAAASFCIIVRATYDPRGEGISESDSHRTGKTDDYDTDDSLDGGEGYCLGGYYNYIRHPQSFKDPSGGWSDDQE